MTDTNFGIPKGTRKPQEMVLMETKPAKVVAVKFDGTADSIDAIREFLRAGDVATRQFLKNTRDPGSLGGRRIERTVRVTYADFDDERISDRGFTQIVVDEGLWVIRVLEGDDEGLVFTRDDEWINSHYNLTGKTSL